MTDNEFDPSRVKALREARRWSQQQLADELGVDQATVSRIENGAEPSKPVRRLLAILVDEIAAKSPESGGAQAEVAG